MGHSFQPTPSGAADVSCKRFVSMEQQSCGVKPVVGFASTKAGRVPLCADHMAEHNAIQARIRHEKKATAN